MTTINASLPCRVGESPIRPGHVKQLFCCSRFEALEAELLALLDQPTDISEEQRRAAQERLALPHWVEFPMLPILLPDRSPDERQVLIEALIEARQLEALPCPRPRLRVHPRHRTELIADWEGRPEQHHELIRQSAALATLCAEQAEIARTVAEREEWREEQLYHLVAAEPAQAMVLMRAWYNDAMERFDLNQAHRWLRPLEERRHLLSGLEYDPATQAEHARWIEELERSRNDLSARSHWIQEWYKTITYLPRDQLLDELDRFFPPPAPHEEDAPHPWLLNLHAPPGYGKTATIDWVLARYALPRGYICARFDYDRLTPDDLLDTANHPARILDALAENLNRQRADQIVSLTRQGELRDDPVGDFTRQLHEHYHDRIVILFVDTVEVLLERVEQPQRCLQALLEMLRGIRVGTWGEGFANLRVVLSGRPQLSAAYPDVIRRSLGVETPGWGTPLLDLGVAGFSYDEGGRYLREMRKLTGPLDALVDDILHKAIDITDDTGARAIVPLKLAMYADMVHAVPDITAKEIRQTDNIDLLYLVKRILERIHHSDLHWLLRYGVIFRRLDEAATGALRPFIEEVRRGGISLDNPKIDPEVVRRVLEASRQQTVPLDNSKALLDQLTLYSWVSRQGGIIRFHPLVQKPQYTVIAQHKRLFNALQQAAYNHYHNRADETNNEAQKAVFLREALYHALQRGKPGATYWRELFKHYRDQGPAAVLQALVEEAFGGQDARGSRYLTRQEQVEAYLALATVLLHKAQAVSPVPDRALLEAADRAIEVAMHQHGRVPPDLRYRVYLAGAKIALLRCKPDQALKRATASKALSHTLGRAEQVAATAVLGEAEAVHSPGLEALETLRHAYRLAQEAPTVDADLLAHVRLTLIRYLIASPSWRDAEQPLAEARAAQPNNWQVLAEAARWALSQARLAEAEALYGQAIDPSSPPHSSLRADQHLVQAYRHSTAFHPLSPPDTPVLGATLAAARTDWAEMESILSVWLHEVPEDKTLDPINLLLQFYLEVTGNRRQAQSMLDMGARWAQSLPDSNPAVARFSVLQQYCDCLLHPIVLKPAVARREVRRRLQQVQHLRTLEFRVKAKAYLLLVRFYGDLDPAGAVAPAYEAVTIYRECAVSALVSALKLLTDLPPFDQLDVIRTMVALPGWSSALANHVAPHPAERTPLYLLRQALGGPTAVLRIPFLAQLALAEESEAWACLATLALQLLAGRSDYALLYTSFARLLAAFGNEDEARRFLHRAPLGSTSELPLPAALDLAALTPWEQASPMLETLVAQYTARPQLSEVCLTAATLALQRGKVPDDWRRAESWLMRLEELPARQRATAVILESRLLWAVSRLYHGDLVAAAERLAQADEAALTLGNIDAGEAIQAARQQIDTALRRATVSRKGIANALDVALLALSPSAGPKEGVVIDGNRVIIGGISIPIHSGSESSTPQEWRLDLRQIDSSRIVAGFVAGSQSYPPHETALKGIRHLISGDSPTAALPTLGEWHRLLLRDTGDGSFLQELGSALFEDLMGPVDVIRHAVSTRAAPMAGGQVHRLRLFVEGSALEPMPLSLLCLRGLGWLSDFLTLTYHAPPPFYWGVPGDSILVAPPVIRAPTDACADIESAYATAATSSGRLLEFGPEFLGLKGPKRPAIQARLQPPSHPDAPKSIHLLCELSLLDEREGVFLTILGTGGRASPTQRLTPPALASRLLSMGFERGLLILEPLATGSLTEDARVLLLRNMYAAALSRLGLWTILTFGPRVSPKAHISNIVQWLQSRPALPAVEEALPRLLPPPHSEPMTPLPLREYLDAHGDLFFPAPAVKQGM